MTNKERLVKLVEELSKREREEVSDIDILDLDLTQATPSHLIEITKSLQESVIKTLMDSIFSNSPSSN